MARGQHCAGPFCYGPQELRLRCHVIAASTAISSPEQKEPVEAVKMTIEKARRLANDAMKTGDRPTDFQFAIGELSRAVLLLADELEQLKSRRS